MSKCDARRVVDETAIIAVARALHLITAILMAALAGCAGAGPGMREYGEREVRPDDGTIIADAYLFDTKTYRDGKPTSVRLELFWTDSAVATLICFRLR